MTLALNPVGVALFAVCAVAIVWCVVELFRTRP